MPDALKAILEGGRKKVPGCFESYAPSFKAVQDDIRRLMSSNNINHLFIETYNRNPLETRSMNGRPML